MVTGIRLWTIDSCTLIETFLIGSDEQGIQYLLIFASLVTNTRLGGLILNWSSYVYFAIFL